ncbi:hypothetical protein Nepgr_000791 [Nepenthes gracilis]|uniref:Uncharacterized protein n=1 Tax=Nepenthes gracilis TaxID=150966 RepID=A0AAD3RVP1_NEPGR|nr:hypothetical protein Nepgr_000791 [Nepenthes gracilis]
MIHVIPNPGVENRVVNPQLCAPLSLSLSLSLCVFRLLSAHGSLSSSSAHLNVDLTILPLQLPNSKIYIYCCYAV